MQFKFIKEQISEFKENNCPVISIDCKDKVTIGNYSRKGTIYTPQGKPIKTKDHDFVDEETQIVHPYGVYCLNDNTGFVNLGLSRDTSEFAANSIYRWWKNYGSEKFKKADKLLILSIQEVVTEQQVICGRSNYLC